jgi:hypothetical protein
MVITILKNEILILSQTQVPKYDRYENFLFLNESLEQLLCLTSLYV